ncbi:hypothetical protein ABZ805_08335 [Saccharopolyspora sp. NPDC047091]|uniref:hypothetical protein n=1 Tax=Saccharopolyspora sp. NPDC047091 TaxID=3155924 RepID=UPI0034022EBE
MRIRIVRAGLFLLFTVLLAVVVPFQSTLCAELAVRNTSEIKTNEIKEHSEKVRQRPAATSPSRRETRTPDPREPLPRSFREDLAARHAPLGSRLGGHPCSQRDAHCVRERHAPAVLQVYRH